MDFEAIIHQIAELEQANRDEERKLMEESAKHKNTKAELDKALLQAEEFRERDRVLQDKVSQMEAESRSAKRTVEEANHDCENFSLATASNSLQLKTDFKSSKQEVVVMQEHLEKQKKLMHDKREEYTHTMESVVMELRKQRVYFESTNLAKVAAASETRRIECETKMRELEEASGDTAKLMEDLAAMTKQLEAVSNERDRLKSDLEAKERDDSVRPMELDEVEQPKEATPTNNSESELAAKEEQLSELQRQLAKESARATEAEDDMSKVLADYSKLDEYVRNVEQERDLIREEVSSILQKLSKATACDKCGAPNALATALLGDKVEGTDG